ncbi:MAG: Ig-like domain-containing protein [Solirubrobacterales bacterium]|nr:Ig-like domain-containing protein [Solirubrobacterales bacterium]
MNRKTSKYTSPRAGFFTVLAILGAMALAPSVAQAAVALDAVPNISPGTGGTVAVGTQAPADVTVTAKFTQTNVNDTIALDQIRFVGACKRSADFPIADPCGPNFDPDVFSTSATGIGAGACAGVTFTIGPPNANGAQLLTPSQTVTLQNGSQCRIDFTVNVLKLPFDVQPNVPGVQTFNLASAIGTITQGVQPGLSGGGLGTAPVTVLPAGAVPPPVTPPPPTNPPKPKNPKNPDSPKDKKGNATLKVSGSGPCAGHSFDVTVNGKRIDSVKFYVDGKLIATDSRKAFSTKINTRKFKVGSHKITIKVKFAKGSKPATKTLTDRFFRCDKPEAPFTGRR